MDVDIPKKFIPEEYTLKCKRSIDELIITSHCMKMMSMACVRYYLIYIHLERFWNITIRQLVH